MATIPERENLDFEEQRVRILRAIEEVEKFAAESRKLNAEQFKLASERAKLDAETRFSPWLLVVQCTLAAAAIMGAGAALAKLFLA